ncbi:uncharacterized protein hyls1 isoform 1-T1 [Anableps anableps]
MHAATMYKMYNDQWDGESDDEKNSLYSSFWSDGDVEDKDEEVEIMRVTDPRPANDPEGSPPESSGEEHSELKSKEAFNRAVLEDESDDDDDRKTTGSAAGSPMTSGYGTYIAEGQKLADHRDDHSVIRVNQDSQEVVSKFRDNKEVSRSLRCFSEIANETTRTPDVSEPVLCRVPAVPACCEDDHTLKEIMKPPVVPESTSEEKHLHSDANDMLLFHEKGLEDGIDGDKEGKQEKMLHSLERNAEDRSAIDESSSSKDAASCLEDRMAELDLASSDQKDYETDENDSQSSETDDVDFSAFESYIKGMTRRDQEVRPKPKSFIRPVMCQRTRKKNDPVARYFQYKEMWEMFQVPGENDRKALRWEIKEKLAYQPPPAKPRRVYVPNTYVVPTEKKRSELRWMIRNDLANGRLPQKFTSQF